jgi:hypothetical protein
VEGSKREAFFRMVAEEPFSRILNIKLVDVRDGDAPCEML